VLLTLEDVITKSQLLWYLQESRHLKTGYDTVKWQSVSCSSFFCKKVNSECMLMISSIPSKEFRRAKRKAIF